MLLLESTIHKKIVDPFGSTEIFRRETPDSDEKFLRSDHGIDLPGYSSHSHSMSYSSSYNDSINDEDMEDDEDEYYRKLINQNILLRLMRKENHIL